MTKTRMTTAVNMDSSPARGSFIRQGDSSVGPGQYDDRNYEFGSNTKSFTIGEKRTERVVESMGPGSYDPDLADNLTKTKVTTTVRMDNSSPSRGTFAK